MRNLSLLAFLIILMSFELPAQVGDGRIYVRRIEFLGTNRIDDQVLRRELLQLEGTHINTVALEQSRLRLERLPYIERAQVTQRPVKHAPDQVDVLITITEAPARRYGGGGGYSESHRASLHGYFVNENILGTGQRFAARIEASEFRTAAEVLHSDPYAQPNGISRTIAISSRRIDQLTADTSELEANLTAGLLEYGYHVAETQAIRFGLSLQDAELITGPLASDQLVDWVRNNGNSTVQGNESSTDYLTAQFLFGWHYDTRDKKVFPSHGLEQLLSFKTAVPGSEVEFYVVDYELSKYWPLNGRWTAKMGVKLGFGAKYGSKTSSLPPNLNWFAGGPNSVRGYRENRLGPKDSLGNPYGGNLFVSAQFELMMPLPEKWQKHLRIGFFYDIGNVFSTENVSFLDDDGQSLDYAIELSELRQSVGIAAKILIPLGVLRLSYGVPINAEDDNPNRFLRDVIERFQIAIGVDF
ncbi:MAG: outer membrane protein assembly factor BamA [Proteobacteria bacterium]|nr:MAG: outer membrane protein assembly factor BamA [Pseudomonadota bacterium]